MKKLYTLSAIVLSTIIFAQEAGKVGELLKNEASKAEMQTQRKEMNGTRTSENNRNGGILDNSNNKNQSQNQGQNKGNNYGNSYGSNTYRWHQNYGYSEVFVRIPERGYFTVEIEDQVMSNASGKYRFFDLSAGRLPISIYNQGYLVYRTKLNIRNNSRMVLDFFSNQGLYLLDSYPVQNQYGFNEWDDVWNNPYQNYGNNGYHNNSYNNNGYNDGYGYGNSMNQQDFYQFQNVFQRYSFDEDKLEFLNRQAQNISFSTQQIRSILKMMSFEENRLEASKMLYANCSDKKNYYMVLDSFSFDSTKRELSRYIGSIR